VENIAKPTNPYNINKVATVYFLRPLLFCCTLSPHTLYCRSRLPAQIATGITFILTLLLARQRHLGMFGATRAAPSGSGSTSLYPDLLSELRTQSAGNAPSQQQHQQQVPQTSTATNADTAATTTTTNITTTATTANTAGNNSSLVPTQGTTDNLSPIQRAARSMNETLMAEKWYPLLDTIVSRLFPPSHLPLRLLLSPAGMC